MHTCARTHTHRWQVHTHIHTDTHTHTLTGLLNGINLTVWRSQGGLNDRHNHSLLFNTCPRHTCRHRRTHAKYTHTYTHSFNLSLSFSMSHTHIYTIFHWFINHFVPSIHLSAEGEGQLEEEGRMERGREENGVWGRGTVRTWSRKNDKGKAMLL